MASKAVRNALTIIGLAHGVADSIERSYDEPPKTIKSMADKIRTRCMECFDLWPDMLDKREIKRINERMAALEGVTRQADGSAAAYTSMSLALLSDLREAVKPGKRSTIDRLMTACGQLHRHYDRRLDRWKEYEIAHRAVNEMYAREG